MFQSYALFPHMSVAGNVAFGLEMLGMSKAAIGPRVRDALDMVKLGDFAARMPAQLSGGQQQRVALARALAPKPSVLLLDEPLSALDLKLRKEMQGELKRLQAETGIAFVLVTHDQEEALAMSDRIAVMRDGNILQVGRPRDIYDNPANVFVADFIGESNFCCPVRNSAARQTSLSRGATGAHLRRGQGCLGRHRHAGLGDVPRPRHGLRRHAGARHEGTRALPRYGGRFAGLAMRSALSWPADAERELGN